MARRGKKARCKENKGRPARPLPQQPPAHPDHCDLPHPAFLRLLWLVIMLMALLATFAGICLVLGALSSTLWADGSVSPASMLMLYFSTTVRKHKHEHACARLSIVRTDLVRRVRTQMAHTPRLCDLPERTYNLHRGDRPLAQQFVGLQCAEREALQQERVRLN